MATPKTSGLARFTRQGATPPGPAPRPIEEASALGSRPVTAPADAGRESEARVAGSREASKAKLVGVYLMPDGHRQLKIEAAKRGATVSDLVREALNAWFTNEHLPPLA